MQLDWLDVLYKIFEVALIPIIATVTAYLVSLIKAKKQEVLEKTKNETIKKYIEILDRTITECVIATNQTYVESLKKQGSFDLDTQKEAFGRTYDAVVNILTDDAQKYLNEAVKDLNTYITNKIETEVALYKQTRT